MEERSLRIYNSEKTFFSKLTNTLTKIIVPTQIGINSVLISMKRNNVLKAYEGTLEDTENQEKKESSDGGATPYGDGITASFEINSEDLNKIASNVSVGLESNDITNGFVLKNSGGGADSSKAVQIKGGDNVTIGRTEDGNITIAATDNNTTYNLFNYGTVITGKSVEDVLDNLSNIYSSSFPKDHTKVCFCLY